MDLLVILISVIPTTIVIGLLGIYLIPKMIKKEVSAKSAWNAIGFLLCLLLAISSYEKGVNALTIGESIGFVIPLIIGSYLITIIKRSGTTPFRETFLCPEMRYALISNFCLGALISLNEIYGLWS